VTDAGDAEMASDATMGGVETLGRPGARAAADCLELARRDHLTIGFAESLTGGLITATFTAIPGASDVVVGGIVAYATRLKAELLDVDRELLDLVGAVDAEVASQMARGAAVRLGADIGVSCTGVAGPDPQDGRSPGEVHVALHRSGAAGAVRSFAFEGSRADVRAATVSAAIDLLHDHLRGSGAGPARSR